MQSNWNVGRPNLEVFSKKDRITPPAASRHESRVGTKVPFPLGTETFVPEGPVGVVFALTGP